MALSVLFAVLMWFLPGILAIVIPGVWIVTTLLASVGGEFCLAGVLEFRSAKTTLNPVNPDASTVLVVRGIYRLT